MQLQGAVSLVDSVFTGNFTAIPFESNEELVFVNAS